MNRLVRDDGTGRERIVCIGEAPAAQEVAQGRPFVGPSGAKLARWHRDVGLNRHDVYWTNVYPYQAPKNQLGLVPWPEVAPCVEELANRLGALKDPYVIVPMGNYALRALLGKTGITKHRGSIYGYKD